jgi:hypothetical protein
MTPAAAPFLTFGRAASPITASSDVCEFLEMREEVASASGEVPTPAVRNVDSDSFSERSAATVARPSTDLSVNLPDAFAVLPQDRTERWERLGAFVSAWHGEVTASDGFPEAELRWAEKRLGVSLPLALCEAYRKLGRKQEVTLAFDRLVPPRKLSVQRGLLVFWVLDDAAAWGISVEDLHLEDPPVFVIEHPNDEHRGALTPALVAEDTSVSRFFVWKFLEQTIQSSRYSDDAPLGTDASKWEEEVGRHLTLLRFAETTLPPPRSAFYGGDEILVLFTSDNVYLSTPNLEAYRRAMVMLVAIPWQASEELAHRGSFQEHRKSMEETESFLRSTAARARAAGVGLFAGRQNKEIPEVVGPGLDPRLRELVERSLDPYARLLSRAAVTRMRYEIEILVESYPGVEPWLEAMGISRLAQGSLSSPGAGSEEEERRLEELTPEQRAGVKDVLASGMVERIAQAIASRPSPVVDGIDSALFNAASASLRRLVIHLPTAPSPSNVEAATRELSRFIDRVLASFFAGMMGALFRLQNTGYFKEATSNGRYLWAIMAFQNIDDSGRHAKTFMIYYKNDYEIDESAQRLNVPISEEQERHSAYLDQVTAGITDEANQLNLPPGAVDAPTRAAGPWLRSLAAKAMLRHELKRKM